MVQVTIDEVVDVIPVRHRFVPATGAVDVIGGMAGARVVGRAVGWILVADRERVLVDVVVVDVVEVPVVQKVDVALVLDGGVPTAVAVGVGVVLVGLAGHGVPSLDSCTAVQLSAGCYPPARQNASPALDPANPAVHVDLRVTRPSSSNGESRGARV
jgi:hypothetical protein